MPEDTTPENTPESGLPSHALLTVFADAFVNRSIIVRDRYGRIGSTQQCDQRILLRAEMLMDISEALRSVNANSAGTASQERPKK
jgi:hypothetical protein